METAKPNEIGNGKFKKLFELKTELKTKIDDYNNKKTIIYLYFINFSKSKKEYKRLKFPSINKDFLISEKNIVDFEYTNNNFPYKNEVAEKISLCTEGKEEEYLINIKKHHENYYTICTDIENEKTYSLEMVFFFKELKDKFKNIIIDDKKLVIEENFPKTMRYNLINVNMANSIKIFNNYSDNKIEQSDNKEVNTIFQEQNLFFNFLYGNNRRIGKIFYNREDKEIEDFKENEKKILEKINEMVIDSKIYDEELIDSFMSLKESQKYYINGDNKNQGNRLIDLNNKFKKIPIFLKYYGKNPSDEEVKIIRVLSILDILLYFNYEEWSHYLRIYINETENIFTKNRYLNNNDKIMILINYLSIIKTDCVELNNYKFESFYELNEDSAFIKSELLYREVISNLTEDSSLFFLYLQLNSGADIDYLELNHFYKVKHISLIEIKTHLLTEYFYPYFFTFIGKKDLMAWNDGKTQIKNYNINFKIYSNLESTNKKYIMNNTVKMTLIKFHEYAHTKFKGNYILNISPRYLLKDNLDYLDNQKKINNENQNKYDENIIIFLGESGQAIEKYIFGDEKIVNAIIYSKGIDLSQLYDPDLFSKKDFNKLNNIIENYKLDIEQKESEEKFQQNRERVNSSISVPKLEIKKCGNVKMYTYSDLNINSTDLWI